MFLFVLLFPALLLRFLCFLSFLSFSQFLRLLATSPLSFLLPCSLTLTLSCLYDFHPISPSSKQTLLPFSDPPLLSFPASTSPLLGLGLVVCGSLQLGPQAGGCTGFVQDVCPSSAPELKLEAWSPPCQSSPPPTLRPGPANPLCWGPTAAEAGVWPAVGVDASGRLTFHVSGDGAEVHPGWGFQEPVKLHWVGGPGSQASGALCGLCCNQRGDAERAGPGRQRAARVHRRPAAWPAPPPTACTQPHRGQPSPRDPGAGAFGATHSHSPGPGDYGVIAPHSWPVAAKGPSRVELTGSTGPFCFSSSWPLTSAPRDLHDHRPSNIPLLPPRLGFPLYGKATVSFYSPRGEAAIPGVPSPSTLQPGTVKRRGAAWARPCPCPQSLPPPPPWLPLHLGEERAVRAPALAAGGQPQGRGVVLSSGAAEQDPAQQTPPAPFSRLTVLTGDLEQRGALPRLRSPGAQASRAPVRAPPASDQDAYTSGGWAVPAPPTSPRTGQALGGPGAGPALAEGAEDTSSEEFRPLGPVVCCTSKATHPTASLPAWGS